MSNNHLYHYLFILAGILLAPSCQKPESCAAEGSIAPLLGEWEGTITSMQTLDGAVLWEGVAAAKVEFNRDYTGTIYRIRSSPWGGAPLDTLIEQFAYSYVSAVRLLDLVFHSEGTTSQPEDADFSQIYDVLELSERLEAAHISRGIDVDQRYNEFSIRWQLQRIR
jgi:hypothetical protein